MVFPDFAKEHPVASFVSVLAFLGGLGLLSVVFSQGSVVGQDGCGTWSTEVNPNTGEPFQSKEEIRQFYESENAEIPEGLEMRQRLFGELQIKTPCGSVGGGVN
jgi:hypothetical protein